MGTDQQAVLLAVVLPIPERTCNLFSFARQRSWRELQAADKNVRGDTRSLVDPVTSRFDPEKSECTEEERIAVEQLAHLRHIRDISMQESVEDCSCATESSFNNYDQMDAIPSLHASDPSNDSNAPSSSAVRNVVTRNPKQKQQRENYVFQFQSDRTTLDGDYGKEHDEAPSSWSFDTNLAYAKPDDVDFNDDGRRMPRSRLLTEIYQDQFTEFQHGKSKKRMRNCR